MKVLYIAILLLIGEWISGQTSSYTISGKITGLDSKYLDLVIYDESYAKGYYRDSILVQNEAFSYSSKIDKTIYVTINPGVERVVKRAGRGYYPAKSSLLQCIISPGANISFSGRITDYVDAYPSGNTANNDLAKLNRMVCPLMNQSVNLMVKLANNLIKDSLQIKAANDTIEMLDNKVVEIKKEFLNENPSSVVSAWLLSDMMIRSQVSGEQAAGYFNKMDKNKLSSIQYYSEVQRRVEGFVATRIGMPSPAIVSYNTYDGKQFDLAKLKGKYVVLDFWGTWCGPCIAGMPKMKEYLEKYKDKIEIVGIAQESDNGDRWKKFLAGKPEYNWPQVLSRDNEDYILKFSVAGFPTKIILDPDGVILARFVGEDENIYTRLDDILN